MVTDEQRLMAAAIIKEMWSQSWYSISRVDECLRILELAPSSIYEDLRKYHCIDFKKMPPGFPEKLLILTLQELTRISHKDITDTVFSLTLNQEDKAKVIINALHGIEHRPGARNLDV
jgi:hypothetical protein